MKVFDDVKLPFEPIGGRHNSCMFHGDYHRSMKKQESRGSMTQRCERQSRVMREKHVFHVLKPYHQAEDWFNPTNNRSRWLRVRLEPLKALEISPK